MTTTLSIAFLAGLISFLSPCVLPLIPGYISYISGQTVNDIVASRQKILVKTILFALGFSVVFISFGATASLIGKSFLKNSNELRWIAGLVVVLFSLHIMGLLNLKFIDKYDKSGVIYLKNGKKIPVSSRKKEQFVTAFLNRNSD